MNTASAHHAKRLMLLFTTTGYNAQDFILAANKLGVEVVLGTDRCRVLEDPWRDAAIPLRFDTPARTVKAIVAYARKQPLDGLIPIGDKPTVAAAFASKLLALPANAPRAAEVCRNKFHSRRALKKAQVPVPFFTSYHIRQNPRAIAPGVRYPCVLKPLSLSASQGVIRANNPTEFESAFQRIGALLQSPALQERRNKSHKHILVEDFIPGREVAVEGMLRRGKLQVLALFDKPDALDGPFFEETLYITPSRLPLAAQQAIAACTEDATRALGLSEGPIHAELRLNDAGPWILEVAARSIGGLCSRTLRFGTGMSLEELVIRHALEMEEGPVLRESAAAGVMMIPIPQSGRFQAVAGIDDARQIRGIEEVTITAKIGQMLTSLPEGSSYLGFIFARGSSPGFVENALRKAHQQLEFTITPELPVI